MQNETVKPFTAKDIRFTTNKGALYALFLGWPEGTATIGSLARSVNSGVVERVTLLGGGVIAHKQDARGLHVTIPSNTRGGFVPVLKLEGRGLA
jgi:alpha-L-fucosidase